MTPTDFMNLFEYNETAKNFLTNRAFRSANSLKGDDAGICVDRNGYHLIRVKGKAYLLHRVIWMINFGDIPEGLMIDHIDGDKGNNKISNLRTATRAQNIWNSVGKKRKESKKNGLPKGITFSGTSYQARLLCNGKQTSKRSKDLNELIDWINSERKKMHKEFANNGDVCMAAERGNEQVSWQEFAGNYQ